MTEKSATGHGAERVGLDLATEQQQPPLYMMCLTWMRIIPSLQD